MRFATASYRAAFAEELTNTVTGLVAKYHDEKAAGGRAYRVILAIHPAILATEKPATENPATETPATETKES